MSYDAPWLGLPLQWRGGLDRLDLPNGGRLADLHIKAAPQHVLDHLPAFTGLRRGLLRRTPEDFGDMLFHDRLRVARAREARLGGNTFGRAVQEQLGQLLAIVA